MKIISCRIHQLTVPLKRPFVTALRTLEEVTTNLLTLETDTGLTGYGEAPPTVQITGESSETIRGALADLIIPLFLGRDPRHIEDNRLVLKHSVKGNTSAKAAMDMALYDLAAQSYDVPVHLFIGGGRRELETDITISTAPASQMADDARAAVQEGYRVLKVKAGKHPDEDIERILAVHHAAGPEIPLRIDANQGWRAHEAVRIIRHLLEQQVPIDLVEQPVRADDLEGLAYAVKSLSTAVAADESVFSPADAIRVLQNRSADVINIKLMKSGGIAEALTICRIAETFKVPCMVGCMMESPVGVQAAGHLAAAVQGVTRVDLDPPVLCAENPVMGGAEFLKSRIILSDEPGFGIIGIRGLKEIAWIR